MPRFNYHRRAFMGVIILSLMLLACQAATPTMVPTSAPLPTGTPFPTSTAVPPTSSPTAAIIPTESPTAPLLVTSTSDPLASNPCKLTDAVFRDVGLGFPPNENRMPSMGAVTAAVLFVDFSDVPATQTTEDVFSIISPEGPEFFRVVSYGRFTLLLEPHSVWLRMSKPSTSYFGDDLRISFDEHRAFIEEAISLADADVDFSRAEAVYVLAEPTAYAIPYGPAFIPFRELGLTVDGKTITNGVTSGVDLPAWGFRWLNHETGHILGLPDLYAYTYDVNRYEDQHRFVGDFSVMGYVDGTAPEPLAYERWLLGWLDTQQIICQQVPEQIVTLTPIETAGGIKALMVPTGPNSAVVIESRRALGYDTALVEPGVLVYTVDISIPGGEGPINVLPANADDPYRRSLLRAGESFTVGAITITVTDATESGDTVRVTISE